VPAPKNDVLAALPVHCRGSSAGQPAGHGVDVADEVPADQAVAARQRFNRMVEALADLPPQMQRAFRLHKLEGLSHGLSGGRLANPLGLLTILQREYQSDFRFTRQGLDRTLGSDIRRIDLIRLRPPRTSQPRGSVWVSETTGELVRTQLRGVANETTTTTFAVDRELRIRVPVAMEDEIGNFRGSATYSNFRRFNVRTESTLDAPNSTTTPR